jgi:hypothetical protein
MDIEFDFKGDPVGGVITKCKLLSSNIYIYGTLNKDIYAIYLIQFLYISRPTRKGNTYWMTIVADKDKS